MRLLLVSAPVLAILALLGGCAADPPPTAAASSNACRDPRLLMACHSAGAGGSPSADDVDSSSGSKGRLLGKRELERSRMVEAIAVHPGVAPPSHTPEPKGNHPPRH
jgi:hypothetical protein